jgi:hypothetical protein
MSQAPLRRATAAASPPIPDPTTIANDLAGTLLDAGDGHAGPHGPRTCWWARTASAASCGG